ncbi:hypothetical protein PRIPAC_84092 [Pristionchus pacificus]|uniref:Uncharacterized protein n=1 Tax=Pristionchus pacificus TaxID=54126 RepID=A0A2A6BTI3_PRIPA|nr:hypothetical protein PRIPAC_84092 [Pristionchus pacificus]|eukprot:PDM69116.1 hypothetical protein PRIPAC_47418 [Pristionchus pacificus]
MEALRNSMKTDFNVTSSGANEASTGKMSVPIVITTLENPKSQRFRGLIFLAVPDSFGFVRFCRKRPHI